MLKLLMLLSLVHLGYSQFNANCDGKQVMVHLFEWKWTDIAAECERYLAGANYCGVQVSPPNEHILRTDFDYPWWQRYQPISYKLDSRSGSESEFIDMVHRCNKVGVRIYVDAVINHMAGKGQRGVGSAGSSFDVDRYDFPGVPYTADDFTPSSLCTSLDGDVGINSSPSDIRNCNLYGLVDLNGRSEYVRKTIAGYLNRLIEIGVAGIRIDAAKYMWPRDIEAILSQLNDLPTDQGFPAGSKLFVFQEVVDYSNGPVAASEYYDTGLVTEFRYCERVAAGINNYADLGNVVNLAAGMARPDRAFVFVDNHDNQRGHGGAGVVLSFKTPRQYKQAVAFTLALPYGFTRIMSSYDFDDSNQGPPRNEDLSTADVTINPDGSCAGGWICEHRWNVMNKMVQFRNAVKGTWMQNYWNNGNAVAFSRGRSGFFAMAKDGALDTVLQTGLPAGHYCNIVDGCATSVQVAPDGMAQIRINNTEEPILAICVDCN